MQLDTTSKRPLYGVRPLIFAGKKNGKGTKAVKAVRQKPGEWVLTYYLPDILDTYLEYGGRAYPFKASHREGNRFELPSTFQRQVLWNRRVNTTTNVQLLAIDVMVTPTSYHIARTRFVHPGSYITVSNDLLKTWHQIIQTLGSRDAYNYLLNQLPDSQLALDLHRQLDIVTEIRICWDQQVQLPVPDSHAYSGDDYLASRFVVRLLGFALGQLAAQNPSLQMWFEHNDDEFWPVPVNQVAAGKPMVKVNQWHMDGYQYMNLVSLQFWTRLNESFKNQFPGLPNIPASPGALDPLQPMLPRDWKLSHN